MKIFNALTLWLKKNNEKQIANKLTLLEKSEIHVLDIVETKSGFKVIYRFCENC